MLRILVSPTGRALAQIFKLGQAVTRHLDGKALLGLNRVESKNLMASVILLSVEARDAYILERLAMEKSHEADGEIPKEPEEAPAEPKIILAH